MNKTIMPIAIYYVLLSLVLSSCASGLGQFLQPNSASIPTKSPTNTPIPAPTLTILPSATPTLTPFPSLPATPTVPFVNTRILTNFPSIHVIVTNNSDLSDGDSSSVDALATSHGKDGGISLREALEATNHTAGDKIIAFAPTLKGASIQIGAAQQKPLPILLGGNLTIDGDIDNDGQPGITMEASLRGGPLGKGINFWSSNNAVQHLHLIGCNPCFGVPVPNDEVPQQVQVHTISDIQILSNKIDSPLANDRFTGILLGPLGWSPTDQQKTLPNIKYQNITIAGNQIDMPGGIFFYTGAGPGGNNIFKNVIIQNNILSHGEIGFMAGDTGTCSQRQPPLCAYSDHNIVEDVTIVNNTITNFRYAGINFGSGNEGNRNNIVQRVVIAENTIIGKPFSLDDKVGPGASGPGIDFCASCESAGRIG